jgi:hypothetical protein
VGEFSDPIIVSAFRQGPARPGQPLDSQMREPKQNYIISIMVTMMADADSVTSIPLHQSTLRVLQRVKSAAETWDEFLINLTDDYLSPSLQAELDRRLKRDRLVSGAEARREFKGIRKLAR